MLPLNTIECSRRTIFGNPYTCRYEDRHKGTTLEKYMAWLFQAVNEDPHALEFYHRSTGIHLPTSYARHIRELKHKRDAGYKLWCPGCDSLTGKRGICHVSILVDMIDLQWKLATAEMRFRSSLTPQVRTT